jgi:hypothetical protein
MAVLAAPPARANPPTAVLLEPSALLFAPIAVLKEPAAACAFSPHAVFEAPPPSLPPFALAPALHSAA